MSIQASTPIRLAAACALLAGACAVAPTHADSGAPSVFTHPPEAGEPLLYARDGSVVEPAAQDVAESGTAGRRDVGAESGRMYLLELYQQVIDERDSLSREVYALRADLEAQSGALGQSQARVIELEGELRVQQAEVQRLGAEGQDLAARLTTAQIRRLQAERLLLEHKLGLQKEREAQAAAAAAPQGQKP
jgi:hypothetical protein